jgi:membrane protease YdiL (CAAX protease family)
MPLWTSIFVSAVVFSCAHFCVQHFLALVLLGMVFGVLYVDSKNLVAPFAAHSLWNLLVLVNIFLGASPELPL